MIKHKDLLNAVPCSNSSLNVYICRPEFSHIQKIRQNGNKLYFLNVKDEDINRLRQLVGKRERY